MNQIGPKIVLNADCECVIFDALEQGDLHPMVSGSPPLCLRLSARRVGIFQRFFGTEMADFDQKNSLFSLSKTKLLLCFSCKIRSSIRKYEKIFVKLHRMAPS